MDWAEKRIPTYDETLVSRGLYTFIVVTNHHLVVKTNLLLNIIAGILLLAV